MQWFLIVAVLVAGCRPAVTPEYFDADTCVEACDHGKKLGCEFAQPTPNGVECALVCIETELTGWSRWYPECVLRATTCEEADRFSAHGCN
jgi:hypothetical protein